MRSRTSVGLALAIFLVTIPIHADDLMGVDRFLCTSGQAFECEAGGGCESADQARLNAPDFVVVDLKKKMLSTTGASGQQRATEIKNLERFDGLIVVQGAQQGRGWSWVIQEDSGKATMSVAIHHEAYVFFGSCTPLPVE